MTDREVELDGNIAMAIVRSHALAVQNKTAHIFGNPEQLEINELYKKITADLGKKKPALLLSVLLAVIAKIIKYSYDEKDRNDILITLLAVLERDIIKGS